MPDGEDPFDSLLARMPAMAKAVAAFPEAAQPAAFDALMAAATGTPVAARADAGDQDSGQNTGQDTGQSPRQGAPSKKRRARAPQGSESNNGKARRSTAAPLREDRDLDLKPEGEVAWEDFAAAKNPTNNHDKHAVAVYYLEHVASLSPVTVRHAYTAWRRVGWKLPANFPNSLRLTAAKKNYIDTGDSNDLRLRSVGMNRVEHELPGQAKG